MTIWSAYVFRPKLTHQYCFPDSILSIATKFQKKDPSIASSIAPFMVEAAWHESEWDVLEKFLSEVTEHTISTRIGKVIACMHNTDRQGVYRALQQARVHCIRQLAAGKLESYVRAYDDILNLQILFELENAYSVSEVPKEPRYSAQPFYDMMGDWRQKLTLMPPGLKVRDHLMDFRGTALQVLSKPGVNLPLEFFFNETDLNRSKAARKEGNMLKAYRSLTKVEYRRPEQIIVEKAKYLWQDGQKLDAIHFLSAQELDFQKKLLLTRWREEMGLITQSQLEIEYQELESSDYMRNSKLNSNKRKEMEKLHYYFGRYYDRIFMASDGLVEEQYMQRAYDVCSHYSRALQVGSKFVYNAMPRLLTIWLELGTYVSNDAGGSQVTVRKRFKDVNSLVLNSNISPQLWIVFLPRLVSRLDHQNAVICQTLINIIRKIFQAYPHSTVWHLISHASATNGQNASSKSRALHCESIMKKGLVGDVGRKILKIVDQAKILVRCLKELAQHPYESGSRSQPIPPSLTQLRDLDISMPIEAALMPTAATVMNLPTIKSFGSKVLVMSSLQKPRRISVLGSDGNEYRFLCKSNDDLRKDARMMEFNVMINTFLRKDRDARERSLYIRTYAVTPLGDLWGLIEWVNHTKPLKAIVHRQWESMGKDISKIAQMTKRELDANNMKSVQERIWAFENKVLPECPAVLHRWFLQLFREPSQWLAARTQFSRTLATMSIVGYILGLGDRHAENILLHEETGDVVHVDVNMLFDRGQKLPVPEVVPFRLTQNLLDAMGPSGYEGTYRRSCEIVLQVLQQNKVSLLSVFETLVHDPIVEWKRYGERQTIQARAKRQLDVIERKINATGNTIQDEVSRLIQEATSNSNLATMFVGM